MEHMSKRFWWWSQWRTSCLPMSGDNESCVRAPKMHNPTWRRWPSEKHLLMTRSNNASSCMQLLCDIQTNCLLGLDARAHVTAAHWALSVWTVCDVHNFYWERFHGKHDTGAYWHYREAAFCGSSIFKNAVWSLYILFIRGPASLKESRGICQLPPEGNVWCWTKRKWKTLKAAQRRVRLHKLVTVYILQGGNKERSWEASKDVTIFYLVSTMEGRENMWTALKCSCATKSVSRRELAALFWHTIAHSSDEHLIILL